MTSEQRERLAHLRRTKHVTMVIETHVPPPRVIVFMDDGVSIGEDEAQIHEDGRIYWAE